MKIKYILQNIVLQASINVVLFCIVLFSFYFFYVTVEEERGIISLLNDILGLSPNDNKDSLIETIIREALKFVPDDKIDYVKKAAEKAETKRAERNNSLITKTVIAILILAATLFAINVIIAIASGNDYKPNIALAIVENIIFASILLFLRYIFFKNVVVNWERLTKESMLYEIVKPYTKPK